MEGVTKPRGDGVRAFFRHSPEKALTSLLGPRGAQ
jgi:hypothetical protein